MCVWPVDMNFWWIVASWFRSNDFLHSRESNRGKDFRFVLYLYFFFVELGHREVFSRKKSDWLSWQCFFCCCVKTVLHSAWLKLAKNVFTFARHWIPAFVVWRFTFMAVSAIMTRARAWHLLRSVLFQCGKQHYARCALDGAKLNKMAACVCMRLNLLFFSIETMTKVVPF